CDLLLLGVLHVLGSCAFFHWCGVHRGLHSFPTRRSSDLPVSGPASSGWSVGSMPESPPRRAGGPAWLMCSGDDDHRGRPGRPQRSEEHTSELQSRENLVCRLLLEKKNNTSPNHSPPPRSA